MNGISNIRFVLAGVNPFYESLINEDVGVNRFIYKSINLGKLHNVEARNLIESKLSDVVENSRENGYPLEIDEITLERVRISATSGQ